ncbi:MAG: hypothetical protein PHC97_03415 [Patescibacteria group bacterium]|nr:hypothetical protein [Patescibacteria group bacterium]
MAEGAPKFESGVEREKTIEDLAKEISAELRKTRKDFREACDNIFDEQGITHDPLVRGRLRSDIGKILGKHSAEMNPHGTNKKNGVEIPEDLVPPRDFIAEAKKSRKKKMIEANPLFSEQIEKENK